MAWDHLDIDKPHVAYMILGGFTSLFMLCSLFIKERLYIGEATVATLCGVIFGPHAAGLFDPISWGNIDKLTLECSRIVLVVQCFAVGVELPKSYMERHWRSVVLLLLPVMTWGWLITSLFIWWLIKPLSWLESLAVAACVTATDPVLASSVVGKGKFAKRVPKHLRDLLSAESGCNDGMAFPFIYLAVYIIAYMPDSKKVAFHWICFTILYECVCGAIFGFAIGYIGRHAIKFAERKTLIDRESFLVFYFVLALFCAGSGSLLGMDDLLIGFAAGVGFSNDGWFTEKTEESHVSNVIDLLLNLTFFVYFGAIIPWQQFNAPELGITPWRLVVIAIMVLLFRRIPIMLLLKPVIPDVKTWREALFAGHFGPIGVGAIFAAILTRAELETHSTQPLSVLPKPGENNYMIVSIIWPITTFMVISSILVHGSSIAVFTLGKRINTLTITMSYTQGDEGPSWMNRLPRIQSQSKSSLSLRKSFESSDDKLPEFPPGTLPPIGLPGNFLRRQRDAEATSEPNSRASSRKPPTRRRQGPGGPISDSAIMPQRRPEVVSATERDLEAGESPGEKPQIPAAADEAEAGEEEWREPELEIYREGSKVVIEDVEGNVRDVEDVSGLSPEQQKEEILKQHARLVSDTSGQFAKSKEQPHERTEGEELEKLVDKNVGASKVGPSYQKFKRHLATLTGAGKGKQQESLSGPSVSDLERVHKERAHRSARAYQFGNTIIVEDEDGEVIKKYTIPASERGGKAETKSDPDAKPIAASEERYIRNKLARMGTWVGFADGKDGEPSSSGAATKKKSHADEESSEDEHLRFTVARPEVLRTHLLHGGQRMSKQDFIRQIQQLDPKARTELLRDDAVKGALRGESTATTQRPRYEEEGPASPASGDGSVDRDEENIPTHDVRASLSQHSGHKSSAAEARRRRFAVDGEADSPPSPPNRRDSEDDGTERIPPFQRRQNPLSTFQFPPKPTTSYVDDTSETSAERKRRLAALGELHDPADDDVDDDESSLGAGDGAGRGRARGARAEDPDSEDDGQPRAVKGKVQFADGGRPARRKVPGEFAVSSSAAAAAGSEGVGGGRAKGENGASTSSGNGGGSGRVHTPRISWGGERGRT
ncbi:sodium/hydrogen antiporter [Polytolypa hystricis UAMH7299]|uniref:Sodium/hydrogen antiporter n=1 Tax=Polytolypa hystricis (strain UAMH7299) TaxID=1447883 RepID=A0A2B7YRW5_POLH7|nr:sodium/hydrogen antiporter [Polytolypa hystricis UAMH7299]